MKRLTSVSEFMDSHVHTLSADEDALDAVEFLLNKHVTGAPVLDDQGKLVGMFTEKDCLKWFTSAEPGAKHCVADFMTTEVETIPSDMDVFYAAGHFLGHNFRRFPVVDDGKLVGAITRYDILRAVLATRRDWA